LVDSGLVERRLGWIFVASATLFFLFFVMVAADGIGVMGNNWLAGAGHGGEKLSIFLICSSIFLLPFSFHTRNSDHIFFYLCSALFIPKKLERHGDDVDRRTLVI
jgi:hypothetical protein